MNLLLALLMLSVVLQAPKRLPPVDECSADASFRRFRSELLAAAERKDKRAILRLASRDIMTDFGGGHGRSAFAKAWKLERPGRSPLWAELKEILRLGCAMEGGSATAPSVMDKLTVGSDAFMLLWAITPGAPVHAGSRNGAIIHRLDWDLLSLADKGGDEEWAAIVLEAGGIGYVRRKHVRSPLDYRAVFQKQDGRWRMTALVAGD